jgi:uncharacterized phage-associated protein
MAHIDDVCDYIILQCRTGNADLNLLKLQKLLYYVQAWSLAFTGKTLFDGKFQAWVHGPVNRYIYDRFADTKSLYSAVEQTDMRPNFDPDQSLSSEERLHIDNVLEVYAPFSGSDLEAQAHTEEPWVRARTGYRPTQRCECELDEALMAEYYRKRVA